MKLGIKRALLLGLGVLAVFTTQAVPAGANIPVNAGVGVVTGGGTIAPGLTVLPAPQTFTFTSVTITTVSTVHKGTDIGGASNCGAAGRSGIIVPLLKTVVADPGDSYAAGAGLGTWGCTTGPLAGKGGLLYYYRVGPVVIVVLTEATKPLTDGVGALACIFNPVTPPPGTTTNYTLTCVGAVVDVL